MESLASRFLLGAVTLVMSASPSLANDFSVKALNSIQCESSEGICRAYDFRVNSIG